MAVDCSQFPCGTATDCPATLACLWRGNDANTPGLFGAVVTGALVFVGTISLAMIILAGFKYITGQADKKAIDSANKTLLFATFGLAIVLFSFFILNIIGAATGVTCIEPQNVFQNGFGACK